MTQPRTSSSSDEPRSGKRRSFRRWIVLAIILIFLAVVFQDVLFPFSGQPYVEISHGNHSHYVPEDRDPDVPLNNFPTRPPEANERIAPDGQIVPVER